MSTITSGKSGVGLLLRRCVQWRVGVGWYLIAIFTRGRLGYNPERNTKLIEVPQPVETLLTSV